MSTTTVYKKNDRLPEYTAQLIQGLGNQKGPINLTGLSVRIHLRGRDVNQNSIKVDASATVDNAAEGRVRYAWAAGDLDTPGSYSVEWEINYGSGRTLTVPSKGYDIIIVEDDLDD